MITWMQRHRKYLVVTIWISTIAFIGAGFVGWGQYSYGDKAGAVAKVGDRTITAEELQKSYSNLFNQYNQVFQGKMDEKMAQQLGLQRQALRQLVNQALVLNLADSYGMVVSDKELSDVIQSQPMFFNEGSFDKAVYEKALSDNRMTKKEYEESLRKELLIQKTLYMLASNSRTYETKTLTSALGVSDKISYKLLTPEMVNLTENEAGLKAFWEKRKKEFKTEPVYEIAYVRQASLSLAPDEKQISEYYEANRLTFKDAAGKIIPLADARSMIIAALNDKATEKEALRLYIDYKKGQLNPAVTPEKTAVTASASAFDAKLTKEIMALTEQKPYLKPRKAGNDYVIAKLEKFIPARTKTYEEAKTQANILYTAELKKEKLQELAKNSYRSFSGMTTDFITRADSSALPGLTQQEASEFLSKLFTSKQKQGFITLESGNVIIYNVLEQKLLQTKTIADETAVAKLKGDVLDQGLIKVLENKYPVEIYVEGI
ncbi:MAG: peptidylprolyl isomerase [Sulfuricurvum sp. MLSB]|uniref:peptidylprolyl isomerase n=1 Tax=unclassified Sulfuricurvum TaxID=2632390 RepID=UPI000508B97D|nr:MULTISPECIES: peptidylprolyl isomerase [unclassified Sulfuricurvum]KFN38538.1 MAG: peptidylprolyl isomerase [Sulfuricurvum sp. MLSB]